MLKLIVVVAALVELGGCGPAARKLRPDDPSYAKTMGEQCSSADTSPQPLVIDWRPEARTDLEVAMRRGVVAVSYDCHVLRVLPDCQIAGGYHFIGVTRKDQKLHLTNADEIRANLPSGVLSGSYGAGAKRSAALDVQLAIVGKQLASASDVDRSLLRGRCEGATHFVRAVTTGAFALDTHTDAALDAQAGGAGSASGTSDKQLHQQDGDPAACATATADATSPPASCSALLRLDLVQLGQSAAQPRTDMEMPRAGTCPTGLVWAGGVCQSPRPDVAHACRPTEIDECARQCELGDPYSCMELGFAHLVGKTVALDRPRAALLFGKACAAAEPYGCNNLGALLVTGTGIARDQRRAVELFHTVCASEPRLCSNLGVALRDGLGTLRDPSRAVEAFSRACLAGNGGACHDVANAYRDGTGGLARDMARASELERDGCRLNAMFSCAIAGVDYLFGRGVPKDESLGVRYLQRSCAGANQFGCGMFGYAMIYGLGGVGRDRSGGQSRMEQACTSGSLDTCKILGLTLRALGDERGGQTWITRACEGDPKLCEPAK